MKHQKFANTRDKTFISDPSLKNIRHRNLEKNKHISTLCLNIEYIVPWWHLLMVKRLRMTDVITSCGVDFNSISISCVIVFKVDKVDSPTSSFTELVWKGIFQNNVQEEVWKVVRWHEGRNRAERPPADVKDHQGPGLPTEPHRRHGRDDCPAHRHLEGSLLPNNIYHIGTPVYIGNLVGSGGSLDNREI